MDARPAVSPDFNRRPRAQRHGARREGLYPRRAALLPQTDGSGRFYDSRLPQGKSPKTLVRVPLRAGQPRAVERRVIAVPAEAAPSPRSSRGEGWGEGLSPRARLAESPPHPALRADLSPQAGCLIHTFSSLSVVPYLMRWKSSRPSRITRGPGFP